MNRIIYVSVFLILIFNSRESQSQVRIANTKIASCIPPWDVHYRWNIIESQEQLDDTLILKLGIREDCSSFGLECGFFTVEARHNTLFIPYQSDTVKYTENGLLKKQCPSSCLCFFDVEFKIMIDSSRVESINYDGANLSERKGIYKPRQEKEYEIYLGDTINLRDQYGIKRGLWVNRVPDGTVQSEYIFYENREYGFERSLNNENVWETFLVLFEGKPISRNGNIDVYEANKSKFPGVDQVEFIRNNNGLLKSVKVTYESGIVKMIK